MLDIPVPRVSQQVISVSELNRRARELLERGLPLTWIAGEISNCKRHDSGHCYFTLKDEQAQIDCVMFRHRLQYLSWLPEDGMRVEVRACATLYEPRGKFQLNVETMRRAGLGALYEAFAKLKARLEREGLFDADLKQPLPPFPRRIGIVTSPQAAALRDVLSTLRRRLPGVCVVLYPAPVQGEGAGRRIAAALDAAAARRECDVLILCRGGGSIEDLWAYNEEGVARAIHACPIPVVTGIGHESDFTIADFVADVRGPTPTGAAVLACPDCIDLRKRLAHLQKRLSHLALRALEDRMQRLDGLGKRLVHPGERIRNRLEALHHLSNRMRSAYRRLVQDQGWRVRHLARCLVAARPDLDAMQRENNERARRLREAAGRHLESCEVALRSLDAHLKHLNPQRVLERGYSITIAPDGGIVRDSAQIAPGDEITVTFAQGWAGAEVKRKA